MVTWVNGNEILKKAIETNGPHNQLNVAIEEMSELIKEICKYKRGFDNIDHIAEEIADCYIVIKEIKMILDIPESEIQKHMRSKLERLASRLEAREASTDPNEFPSKY